jgi:sugar lactone lactonase YvrE
VDAAGDVFIADTSNSMIRKVSDGIISTVAGIYGYGYGGDGGPATSAVLGRPYGVAVDAGGNLYIADTLNHRVRKVTNGIITAIAGNGIAGYTGDGGPATSASLEAGLLALDNAGNLYVSAFDGNFFAGTPEPPIVRKISDGTISTVPGIAGVLQSATGLAVDASGNLFVADTLGNRVYKVSNGVASVVAGTGARGFSGDGGLAANAQLSSPLGLAVGPNGDLYIADTGNNRVRAVSFPGAMPQIASAGNWDTLLTLVNLNATASQATLSFSGDSGSPLSLPFTFPQGSSSPVTASTITQMVNSNAVLLLDTTGPNEQPATGWAQLLSSGGITGYAIFSNAFFKWNAVVPLDARNASSYLVPFDNTGSLTTGVALANMVGQAGEVNVIVRDDTGVQLETGPISLPALGHTSFTLPSNYASSAGKRGTVEFDTPAGGWISVLGLRANQISKTASALTTLPVLANVDASGGSITHATWNGGFTTIFTLVNTGAEPASATLSFSGDDGGPLVVPLSFPQTGATTSASTVTRTIQPNASLVIETIAQDALPAVQGSALLTTTGNVGGFAIFRWTTFGQEASVPIETRNLASYILPFDNTGGLTTGLAIANLSGQAAFVPVRFRDDTGAALGSATISLPGHGHTSFLLPDKYKAAIGKRGTVEFDTPAGGQISVVGLRAKNDGTLTTIPVLGRGL